MGQDLNTVCVFGLGYIGLPTAGLLASQGFQVNGCDVTPSVVETINSGAVHIVEPDLDLLIKKAVSEGQLKAFTAPVESDVYMIAVPTPFKENHKPDVRYVKSVATQLAPLLKAGDLIIIESTCPVGTTENFADWISELRSDLSFNAGDENQVYLAYCPERVLPGHILRELVHNDRVIGGINELSAQKAQSFYSKFVKGGLVTTHCRAAEMSKLTENAYRDVNIAFANECSRICDELGVDVWELISLANRHPRVNILNPGPGVGGHCIAVDPWFIVDAAPEQATLIKTSREINDSQPQVTVDKFKKKMKELCSQGQPVILYGLSYKPNIDDLRESPAVDVARLVCSEVSTPVWVVEPNVKELPSSLSDCSQLKLVDQSQALAEQEALHVFLVSHTEFTQIDIADRNYFDAVGIFSKSSH